MRVKDLIRILQGFDPEATVISQEYTGCTHTLHDIQTVRQVRKGEAVPQFNHFTDTESLRDRKGHANRPVVFIN